MCTLLPEEQWEFLFQKTLRFAQYQIDRLSWRGEPGGILPDGFDANSIAAQAIMDWRWPPLPMPTQCRPPKLDRQSVRLRSPLRTVQRLNIVTI
jgi:hypothetical protein